MAHRLCPSGTVGMSRILTISFGLLLALFCVPPAFADTCAAGLPAGDVCYDLNVPTIGGGQYYAQVAIQQLNPNPTTNPAADSVQVTVTLSDATKFAKTGGPHTTFAFDLATANLPASDFSICPSGTCTASQWASSMGGSFDAGTYGTFDYHIDLSSSGASGDVTGPLVFDITTSGITAASFINSSSGYRFAADVCSPGAIGGACTGEVARLPEPPTPFL